jgi:hypothetical protein
MGFSRICASGEPRVGTGPSGTIWAEHGRTELKLGVACVIVFML